MAQVLFPASARPGMDAVAWEAARPLRWADYAAEFDHAAAEDARTHVRFRPEWTLDQDGWAFVIRGPRIVPEMVPGLSWVRPGCATGRLLRHEQGRFDLAELACRGAAGRLGLLEGRALPGRGGAERGRDAARDDSAALLARVAGEARSSFEAQSSEYSRATRRGADAGAQSEYDARLAALRG